MKKGFRRLYGNYCSPVVGVISFSTLQKLKKRIQLFAIIFSQIGLHTPQLFTGASKELISIKIKKYKTLYLIICTLYTKIIFYRQELIQ